MVAGLLALSAGTGMAAEANQTETWDDGTKRGWVDESAFDATLSNPGTALRLSFPSQGAFMYPSEDGVKAGSSASEGVFVGDYEAVGITNITFDFVTDGHTPNTPRVYFVSSSGRQWSCYNVQYSTTAGEVVANNLPLEFSAWQLDGPGATREMFEADWKTVTTIGVRMMQMGTEAQAYTIDNFCLLGPKPYELIAGTVTYGGYQQGPIQVMAVTNAASWDATASVTINEPGAFEIPSVPTLKTYWIKAYRDSNRDGVAQSWEAMGTWAGGAIKLVEPLTGVSLPLTETADADGLPTWWVVATFGEGSIGSGAAAAGADADGDGASNYHEYKAGTDAQNAHSRFEARTKLDGSGIVLTWPSTYTAQRFTILRTSALGQPFTAVATDVVGTPPENTYEDSTATGKGPYFYKVLVQ
jgi:hypothetical protein